MLEWDIDKVGIGQPFIAIGERGLNGLDDAMVGKLSRSFAASQVAS